MGPPPGVPGGSSPQTEEWAELAVPVLEEGYLSADRPTLLELSPPAGLPPTLLKESLMARLPSLAWVFPGLRACLMWIMTAVPLVNFDPSHAWSFLFLA